jgi:hypothetical protein
MARVEEEETRRVVMGSQQSTGQENKAFYSRYKTPRSEMKGAQAVCCEHCIKMMNAGFFTPISNQKVEIGKTTIKRGRSTLARREKTSPSKAKRKRGTGGPSRRKKKAFGMILNLFISSKNNKMHTRFGSNRSHDRK